MNKIFCLALSAVLVLSFSCMAFADIEIESALSSDSTITEPLPEQSTAPEPTLPPEEDTAPEENLLPEAVATPEPTPEPTIMDKPFDTYSPTEGLLLLSFCGCFGLVVLKLVLYKFLY